MEREDDLGRCYGGMCPELGGIAGDELRHSTLEGPRASNALIVPDEVAPSSQMIDVEVSLLVLRLQVVARAFAPSVGGDLIDWLRIATAWIA